MIFFYRVLFAFFITNGFVRDAMSMGPSVHRLIGNRVFNETDTLFFPERAIT